MTNEIIKSLFVLSLILNLTLSLEKRCLKKSFENDILKRADNEVCPKKSDEIFLPDNRRLYGSRPTKDHEEPDYYVFLDFKFPKGVLPKNFYTVAEDHKYCGGTLIHTLWVLTAASCMCAPGGFSPINVRTGSYAVLGEQKEIENMFSFSLIVANVHPDFNPVVKRGNLGLVELEENAASITKSLRLAKLGFDLDPAREIEVIIYGFGSTTFAQSKLMTSLRIVKMKTKKHPFCEEAAYYCDIYSRITNFCVHSKETVGPSNEDIGGGAYFNHTLLGVISWGTEGAGAVLENVAASDRLGWINYHINDNIGGVANFTIVFQKIQYFQRPDSKIGTSSRVFVGIDLFHVKLK